MLGVEFAQDGNLKDILVPYQSAAELKTANWGVYICVLILLYMCPHTAMCVSSCCYICVLMLLYMCPHTAICVSSYCYMCVLMLLYVCPHAAICVSLSYFILNVCAHPTTCVLILLCVCAGLHDPVVLKTLLIADGDAVDYIDSAGHQQVCCLGVLP